eukprot:gene6322-6972_t
MRKALLRYANRVRSTGHSITLDKRILGGSTHGQAFFSTKLRKNHNFDQTNNSDRHHHNNNAVNQASSGQQSFQTPVKFSELGEHEKVMAAEKEYFIPPEGTTSFHQVRSGSYLPVSTVDIKKFLPEGFAGSLSDEFTRTSQQKWMVRDGSKLLLRLLQEVQATLKPFSSQTQASESLIPTRGLDSIVHMSNVTDRPEWPAAKLKVQLYAREVKPAPPAPANDMGFIVSNGEGSLAENYVQEIKKPGGAGLPDRILLTGQRGVGKSVMLNQVVLEARRQGWLTVFIPDGWKHANTGSYIDPVENVTTAEGLPVFNNAHMTAVALRGLWHAHGSLLSTLPIQDTSVIAKYARYINRFNEKWARVQLTLSNSKKVNWTFLKVREIVHGEEGSHDPDLDKLDEPILSKFNAQTFEVKTLADLITVGIALLDTSGFAFIDLIAELRRLENIPVLFAVDGYNTWMDNAAFYYDSKRIQGRQLAVPYALSFFDTTKEATNSYKLKNGFCIATTSLTHPEGLKTAFEQEKASIPFILRVPVYNQTEFLSVVSHYLNNAPVGMHMSASHLQTFRIYTASVGETTRKELFYYFIPLVLGQNNEKIENALWMGSIGTEDDEELQDSKAEGNKAPDFDSAFLDEDEPSVDDDEFDSAPKGKAKGKVTKGKPVKGKK